MALKINRNNIVELINEDLEAFYDAFECKNCFSDRHTVDTVLNNTRDISMDITCDECDLRTSFDFSIEFKNKKNKSYKGE